MGIAQLGGLVQGHHSFAGGGLGESDAVEPPPVDRSPRLRGNHVSDGKEEAGQQAEAFYKTDAVSLVLDEGRTLADAARLLDIGDGNLGNWVRQARVDRGEREGLTTEDKAELVELRRDNARLRMERDLLKRATAFWVMESQL